MNILVTGGAGFIGRWLVKRLVELGHEIYVIDNLFRGDKKNLEGLKVKEFVVGDIRDKEALEKVFKNKIDICLHLASTCDVQHSIENPEVVFDVDVLAGFHLLNLCKKNNTKVILISTGLVYKDSDKPLNEENPTRPSSPYAAAKLAEEHLFMSYYITYGHPVVVLRPFNTYGPHALFTRGNAEGSVIPIFIKRKLTEKPLEIFGSGEQIRDFLYVEDCVDFIVKAAFSENAVGEVINAGYGRGISINELALLIAKDKSRIRHIPHHHPQSEIKHLVCDNSKAKRLFGWQPQTSLEKGLVKTEEWIKRFLKNEPGMV